jgi:3',5'-cyclic AMP phosphodiesterase CpdA
MNRSTFIKSVLLATTLPLSGFSKLDSEKKKKPTIRFAHLTDIHVQEGAIQEAGMEKVLQHVQNLKEKPGFIINGGDAIMDSLEADKEKTKSQWAIFNKIINENNKLPLYHCIGNHDIWGWFVKDPVIKEDPLYGKNWVVETLKMPKRYYTFQEKKWHFIVLDSTQLNENGGYIAKIDEEQFSWLKNTLQNIPQENNICIVSHIPILSVCSGLFWDKTEANGDRLFKRNLMHTDFIQLKELFLQHPNVKVCLSGHIHMQDEVDYLGIKYYCNGAVSGNWWKGSFHEFPAAYALIELYDDGSSKRIMHEY